MNARADIIHLLNKHEVNQLYAQNKLRNNNVFSDNRNS
jgi:hypothetical protein